MATRAIYTKLERWFTDVAVQRGLITQEDVHSAIEAQVTSRQQEGRSPHIWEILMMQERLGVVEVDEILSSLGKSEDDAESAHRFNLLGRVLVEVGYAQPEDIHRALAIQAKERADGQWRLLGQILISMKVLREPELQEALIILERRRKNSEPPKEEEADAADAAEAVEAADAGAAS